MKIWEIRDPIYGFIEINEWEKEIIDHWIFQRLRRVLQLGPTYLVYPGAMHTRFEHSLGVMHIATLMYDSITRKCRDFFKSELQYDEAGLSRDRVLVRLSALLHDIGHSPFSHAGEELFEENIGHEDYSAEIIKTFFRDTIENHSYNENYRITAQDIANFLIGDKAIGRSIFWRDLIIGQIDADRADYLLRDSYHIGVAYGKYDYHRLIQTLTIASLPDTEEPIIAIEKGGLHVAEALIIARYMMFTQVYFHHTRRAYDFHILKVLRKFLRSKGYKKGKFPAPNQKRSLENYLKLDDWEVQGAITRGEVGGHGEIIKKRKHYRSIYETPESPRRKDIDFINKVIEELKAKDISIYVDDAQKSWYKFDKEIIISEEENGLVGEGKNLSEYSNVVKNIYPVNMKRIYVPLRFKSKADKIIKKLKGG